MANDWEPQLPGLIAVRNLWESLFEVTVIDIYVSLIQTD
jgi:hypothetical protein